MGDSFVARRPLVPLPTICRENTSVENELICIVNYLLGGVGRGSGVGVREFVINLLPDNLDVVGGGVCLAEALVLREPVGVGYDIVDLIQVGEQIQRAGFAILSVWPVFDPHKVVLNSAQKFLTKGEVYVTKGVERQLGRVVSVADGRCFGSVGAFRDNGRHFRVGRGDDPCCQEGPVYGGVDGEADLSELAAAEVYIYGRCVPVKELVHVVDRGIRRFAFDWWDRGVF